MALQDSFLFRGDMAIFIIYCCFFVCVFSGVGDTIVTMLTDYNGFWQYDNRESFAEDDDESCNAAVWGKIHFAQSVGGIRQG